MATRFSNTILGTNTPASAIQAWAQFVEDTLVTTGGWVVTSDAGQTAPASLTTPAGASTKVGYRIYRMNDALQGTFPVFMRLDFGSTVGAAANPAIWVTIGTGSNGSGTITGVLYNGGAQASGTIGCTGGAAGPNSYGSANANRFAIALFTTPGNNINMVFTLERSKDSAGNDTGDGLIFIHGGGVIDSISSTARIGKNAYLIYAGGTQPTEEIALSYVLTSKNPSETFGGDIGVGLVISYKGVAQQPGTNVAIVNAADVAAQGSFAMVLYGVSHTYQQLDAALAVLMVTPGNFQSDANARACIRYD